MYIIEIFHNNFLNNFILETWDLFFVHKAKENYFK